MTELYQSNFWSQLAPTTRQYFPKIKKKDGSYKKQDTKTILISRIFGFVTHTRIVSELLEFLTSIDTKEYRNSCE